MVTSVPHAEVHRLLTPGGGGKATYLVKFVVETAGVTDRFTLVVTAPECGHSRRTVGTLETSPPRSRPLAQRMK